VRTLANRLMRAEAQLGPTRKPVADRSAWQWYGGPCPCGLPLGDCAIHPRAREAQRPPDGPWRTWGYIAGRGAGKTRAGACWIQDRAETGVMRLGCLIAPTAADIRDTLVEGPSGLLAIAPPWCRPKFLPSKRRVTWPNGARAICLSGEEPERARGLNIDTIWADELACWQRAESTWDMALLALRAGSAPQAMVTTTPRPSRIVKRIMGEPTTRITRGTTFDNKHLAPEFVSEITAMFAGSRLAQQELMGELCEAGEGVWFDRFDVKEHVSETAEYVHGLPVHLAIDAGTSRTTGAVWFQVHQVGAHRWRIKVFGEYCATGLFSEANVRGIRARSDELPSRGHVDVVRIDPASGQRTGIGPAAFEEYTKAFPRLARSPAHRVADGLDQMEVLLDRGNLLIHPRCAKLKEAFLTYRRAQRGDEWLNDPAGDQSPHEDLIDALRYGIRSRFPEGRVEQPHLKSVHITRLFG
jgi:Terminase large subunit, T4likevirus-type, N-terminal